MSEQDKPWCFICGYDVDDCTMCKRDEPGQLGLFDGHRSGPYYITPSQGQVAVDRPNRAWGCAQDCWGWSPPRK